MKMQDLKMEDLIAGMKMQDLKMKDLIAGHENAGPENEGPIRRA